jgi:hypothetical protein
MAVKFATTCWVPQGPSRTEYPVGVRVMEVSPGSVEQAVKGMVAANINKAPNKERSRIKTSPGVSASPPNHSGQHEKLSTAGKLHLLPFSLRVTAIC